MENNKDMFKDLNKYRLVSRVLLVIDQDQEVFSEEDVKEAISILHQTVFPEKYPKK